MRENFSKLILRSLKKTTLSFSKEGVAKYLKNAQWLTLARIGTMLFAFVTTTVIARVFGPEKFGTLSYVLSAVGLFGIVAGLGIDNVVYREITAKKEDRETILGTSILLKTITGAIAIVLVFILTLISNESTEIKILMITCSLVFVTQPILLLSYDFLKDAESKYVAISQMATLLIASVAKIVTASLFGSVFFILIILALENIITGTLLWFTITRIKKRGLRLMYSKKYFFLLLQFSLPLTLYSASEAFYSKIDQVMLRHYLDLQTVGIYSAAVRLTEIWYFVPNIIMGALFPAFIHAQKNKVEYFKRVKAVMLSLTIFALIISLLTLLFGGVAVSIIFGEDYILATPILSLYIFSLLGSYLSFVIYQDLFIRSKISQLVLISFSAAFCNITLNYFWIPLMGAKGAAFATLVSYTFIPLLYFLIRYISRNNKNEL